MVMDICSNNRCIRLNTEKFVTNRQILVSPYNLLNSTRIEEYVVCNLAFVDVY